MFRKLFRRSPKCAACQHPRYRHKMSAILGYRICLNMLCACPDYKDPELVVGHRLDFGSGVFDVNTIRSTLESANKVHNNVMYDNSGLEDIFPEIIDTRVDTQGHPLIEHIFVNGRTYPVEFIQHYLQEDWAMLHSGYASWLEEAYKTEGD